MASLAGEYGWIDIKPAKHVADDPQAADIMRRGAKRDGGDRVWWTNGDYLWFRPRHANAETLKRHQGFMAKGDYEYVATYDDVEVYRLTESSQFKRRSPYEISTHELRRRVVKEACKRNWENMLENLHILRGRFHASYHQAAAESMYADELAYIAVLLQQTGGPSMEEVNREITAYMQRRPKDIAPGVLAVPGQ